MTVPIFQALQEGFITHRGAGAFIDEDFVKKEPGTDDAAPAPINKTAEDGNERAVVIESNLVKPSEKNTFLKDE